MNVLEFEHGEVVAQFDGSDLIDWPAWAECYSYAEQLFNLGRQVWIREDWLPPFHDADEFIKPLRDEGTSSFQAELPIAKKPARAKA